MKKCIAGFLLTICLNTSFSFELSDAVRITDSINAQVAPDRYVILEKYTQKLEGNGLEIIRSAYYCAQGEYCPGEFSYTCVDSRYGLRLNGSLVLLPVLDRIIPWENNTLLVRLNEYAWIVDVTGKPLHVLECVDSYASYYTLEKNGKNGVIDKNFEEIVPFEYDAVGVRNNYVTFIELNADYETTSELSTYPAQKNGKWGIIDDWNKIRCPFDYDAIDPNYWSDRITAKKGGYWGQVDFEQNMIIPFEYDSIISYDSRHFLKKGEKWATINIDEKVTDAEFIYDEILFPGCANADLFVRKGKLWYGLDESGQVVWDDGYTGILIYKSPYGFTVPYYAIQKGGKWGIYSCDKADFVTDFGYKKVVNVEYTRGQQYNEDGALVMDYPVYIFTVVERNEEVTLRLSSYE